jgi:Pyruvate/2-oxoacid:ferredoxin oxidoreductase delta subunit
MANTNVVVTPEPRRCTDCGRYAPASARAEDEHLYFGADKDDYDRTRCAACARTNLHKCGVPHYPQGCKLCSDSARQRSVEAYRELRRVE